MYEQNTRALLTTSRFLTRPWGISQVTLGSEDSAVVSRTGSAVLSLTDRQICASRRRTVSDTILAKANSLKMHSTSLEFTGHGYWSDRLARTTQLCSGHIDLGVQSDTYIRTNLLCDQCLGAGLWT
ncbi:hypothetical protein RRG08_024436 [Elysia crispata]|uniref:Uncharacterized protein n=1 Tax=Elysia crispata TaxID=231223 RepID=A0AAE0YP53_9GAST|nr:hypothetical protein RRG08_024436 [Elysia crispata]